ncbi:MAG: hypothetical protein ACE5KE_04130 [Methanosarcinales archaeon]
MKEFELKKNYLNRKEENELIPLKELAKESPYSHECLSLRARQGELDAVKLGRIWYSTKRALKQYMQKLNRC